MTPRIVYSPLSRRWYVATRYVQKVSAAGVPYIVATRKYDVSDQMHAILSKAGRAAVKRGKPARVTA
jgi:hypothetical protein